MCPSACPQSLPRWGHLTKYNLLLCLKAPPAPPSAHFFRHFKVNPRQQLLKEAGFTLTQLSSERHASRRAARQLCPRIPLHPGQPAGAPPPAPRKVHGQATLPRDIPRGKVETQWGPSHPTSPRALGPGGHPELQGGGGGEAQREGLPRPAAAWMGGQRESKGAQSREGQLRTHLHPRGLGRTHIIEVGPASCSPPHTFGNH